MAYSPWKNQKACCNFLNVFVTFSALYRTPPIGFDLSSICLSESGDGKSLHWSWRIFCNWDNGKHQSKQRGIEKCVVLGKDRDFHCAWQIGFLKLITWKAWKKKCTMYEYKHGNDLELHCLCCKTSVLYKSCWGIDAFRPLMESPKIMKVQLGQLTDLLGPPALKRHRQNVLVTGALSCWLITNNLDNYDSWYPDISGI